MLLHEPKLKPPTCLLKMLAKQLRRAQPSALSDSSLRRVKSLIAKGQNPSYERDARAFAYLYFAANFLKSAYAVNRWYDNKQKIPAHILDLGCGAGASSAGAVWALQNRFGGDFCGIKEITGVDHNSLQLNLFRGAFGAWAEMEFPKLKIGTVQRDAVTYLDAIQNNREAIPDLIIVSYLLTELSTSKKKQLRALLEHFDNVDRSDFIIIEEQPDSSGCSIEYATREKFHIDLSKVPLALDELRALGLSLPPKYATHPLITEYFKAWETHDLHLLRRIFSQSAQYLIHHPNRTLTGLPEIEEYWKRNASQQRGVHCVIKSVKKNSENTYGVTWEAEFDRIAPDQQHYLVKGMMNLTIIRGRITRLWEDYSVIKSAIL